MRGPAVALLCGLLVAIVGTEATGGGAGPAGSGPHSESLPLVVFLGDSITEGYRLAEGEAYPAVVAARLAAEGRPIRAVNAGVSGDTSAGALRRLAGILDQRPDVVVVALGANDGLRGQPLDRFERNLSEIIQRSLAADARVLLLGMRLPPNYGPRYGKEFAAVYPRLAKRFGVALMPFLLEGVAGRPELNLADGFHPNARGHRVIAGNVLPGLRKIRTGARGQGVPPIRVQPH